MLVLNRKKGETVLIGDNVRVTILTNCNVRVGIEAPKEVKVLRGELAKDEKPMSESKANARLMDDAPMMLDALRELVDFGSSTNYQHQERSQNAYEKAIEILERHGG